jgi:heme oxygenase (biliverdin-producing, ferredoxin)
VSSIPFSQELRERTSTSHGESEGASFMNDLIKGRGSREDYVALVAQHYFIYEALERVAEQLKADPIAGEFISEKLTRLPALERDLEFLGGPGWRALFVPVPATARYIRRIDEVAAAWSGAFIAHHYTRYLGDLSGGQFIRTLMQRQFGFADDGVAFYAFDQIPDAKAFKNAYRARLDAVPWTDDERERVIDEALVAYQLNTDVFDDLARAKAAA